MEKVQFNQTRMNLNQIGLKISSELNAKIRSIIEQKDNLSDLEQNVQEVAGHIYLVNQYLLKKIEKLNALLHEGLVNQESEYFESDFTLVETMLNVSVFKIKSCSEFNIPVYFSLEELELKLAVQLKKLISLSKNVPPAYANNYRTEMKVIPGIKLDIYQLIFFAMKHSGHHLNQISTLIKINEAFEVNRLVYN
jgi:hypothetical protein